MIDISSDDRSRVGLGTYIFTPGPYWYPPFELLRQNVAEDQAGVPLELEIGLIDVNTCEPLEYAMISIWVSISTHLTFIVTDHKTALQRNRLLQQLRIQPQHPLRRPSQAKGRKHHRTPPTTASRTSPSSPTPTPPSFAACGQPTPTVSPRLAPPSQGSM